MIKTSVAKIETNKIDKKIIRTAVKILKWGKLVIYPTETCYGLGCDWFNTNAIKKIYKIKKRDQKKPLPIIVSSRKMIDEYAIITPKMRKMMKKFMPGPLTIIAKTKEWVRKDKGMTSIAFRISSNPVAMSLVKSMKVPIVATSANISGEPPLYIIENVIKFFKGNVEMIIDYGNLEKIKPSTCVDMTNGEMNVIREGPVKRESIYKELIG